MCLSRALLELKKNTSSGQELWGRQKLCFYRSAEGTEIVYRIALRQIQVLAFRLPRAYHFSTGEKICAIILAAGRADYKEVPLQLASIEGTPLISRVTEAFIASEVDDLVVVLGYQAERIKEELANKDASKDINIVVNPNYDGGLSSSLKYGLRMVSQDTAAVVLTLGNRPFINSKVVNTLISAYKRRRSPAIVPVCHQVRGHPVIFSASLIPELLRLRGNVGGKRVLRRYQRELTEVEIENKGIFEKLVSLPN